MFDMYLHCDYINQSFPNQQKQNKQKQIKNKMQFGTKWWFWPRSTSSGQCLMKLMTTEPLAIYFGTTDCAAWTEIGSNHEMILVFSLDYLPTDTVSYLLTPWRQPWRCWWSHVKSKWWYCNIPQAWINTTVIVTGAKWHAHFRHAFQ